MVPTVGAVVVRVLVAAAVVTRRWRHSLGFGVIRSQPTWMNRKIRWKSIRLMCRRRRRAAERLGVGGHRRRVAVTKAAVQRPAQVVGGDLRSEMICPRIVRGVDVVISVCSPANLDW